MMQVVQEVVHETQSVCSHCHTALTGDYCSQCGQKVRKRLTMNAVTTWVVGAFSFEKGILHTTAELLKRPGAVVQAYINGHTRPYSNPVRYYLLMMTVWQLIALWTGGIGELAEGFAEGMEEVERAGEIAEFIATYFVAGLAGLVVFWTAVSRLVFLKSGLNLAEHAVFYLYMFGLLALYQSVLFVLIALSNPFSDTLSIAISVVYLLVLLVWFVQVARTARDTFQRSWWYAVLGSLFVLGLGTLLYFFLFGFGIFASVTL